MWGLHNDRSLSDSFVVFGCFHWLSDSVYLLTKLTQTSPRVCSRFGRNKWASGYAQRCEEKTSERMLDNRNTEMLMCLWLSETGLRCERAHVRKSSARIFDTHGIIPECTTWFDTYLCRSHAVYVRIWSVELSLWLTFRLILLNGFRFLPYHLATFFLPNLSQFSYVWDFNENQVAKTSEFV